MTCFAQRSGKRRKRHCAIPIRGGQLLCMRCETWLDSDGNEVLLTDEELSQLAVVANTAAGNVRIRHYEMTARMLAAAPVIANLLPRLLAEVTARRRSRPRRGRG